MGYIRTVKGKEILDSRGLPTLEVTLEDDRGVCASASVPAGASTGEHEACDLRDGDEAYYFGKGVSQALAHVHGVLAEGLVGQRTENQEWLDRWMIEADGTPQKSRIGANAILAVSMALARLGALQAGLPLYRYLGGTASRVLPQPMMNLINGGAHADNNLEFQEFMIIPKGAQSLKEALRWGREVFETLRRLLIARGYSTGVGDEGGFAPNLRSDEEALELLMTAIEEAGFRVGEDVSLALDCAASEFYNRLSHRYTEKKREKRSEAFSERTSEEQVEYLVALVDKYPIDSIEDGLAEWDWNGWSCLTGRLGNRVRLVGDDLFVTQLGFLKKGIQQHVANAILIKPNQVGTVSETIHTVAHAQRSGYTTVISHRSGETEDSFIADLSVAVNAGWIKTGSLCRSERIAKYNRLLAIEADLGALALYGYRACH